MRSAGEGGRGGGEKKVADNPSHPIPAWLYHRLPTRVIIPFFPLLLRRFIDQSDSSSSAAPREGHLPAFVIRGSYSASLFFQFESFAQCHLQCQRQRQRQRQNQAGGPFWFPRPRLCLCTPHCRASSSPDDSYPYESSYLYSYSHGSSQPVDSRPSPRASRRGLSVEPGRTRGCLLGGFRPAGMGGQIRSGWCAVFSGRTRMRKEARKKGSKQASKEGRRQRDSRCLRPSRYRFRCRPCLRALDHRHHRLLSRWQRLLDSARAPALVLGQI